MNEAQLKKNSYGYFEVLNKPSVKDLQEYYAKKYYQDGMGSYEARLYNEEELEFFHNKINQKYFAIMSLPGAPKNVGRFLDVGAGEGFAIKYFYERGWQCLGLDFCEYGIKLHNPEVIEYLKTGDIFLNLDDLINNGEMFDVIFLDNVLEHVIDPKKLLEDLHRTITDNGVLMVDVPNDFSPIQKHVIKNKIVSRQYWVAPPDHLSYFNMEGFTNLSTETGWRVEKVMTDYPIDFNLLNPNTNYIEDSNVGKSCHQTRIAIENILSSISIEKTNKLYEALADLGLGRVITALLRKN